MTIKMQRKNKIEFNKQKNLNFLNIYIYLNNILIFFLI